MSGAREDVARIAPGMADEDLARLLQLEEERAYQQQLAGLAESLQYRVSISSKFQSSSTSPSSSSGRPVAGKFGPRKPGRSPGGTLANPPRTVDTRGPRPQWCEVVAQGSSSFLAPRFFPRLPAANASASPKKGTSGSNAGGEPLMEMECGICTETRPSTSFISTTGCRHKYCADCCKQHAEVKVSSGSSNVECPHPDCCDVFDVVQCMELLSQPSFDILTVRQTEAAIPSSHRVYCPFPDCSAFMEKSESSSGDSAFVECWACHRGFCLSCSAAWHAHQTCAEHRADAQNAQQSGDQKLRELADQEKWQECSECHRMIELNEGCYHMTCLCGNEFCYTCGARWKNKVASCRCKLWDESNIVRSRPGRRFLRGNVNLN